MTDFQLKLQKILDTPDELFVKNLILEDEVSLFEFGFNRPCEDDEDI